MTEDDPEFALAVAKASESLPRWQIAQYAPYIPRAFEVVDHILTRWPALGEDCNDDLAYAARIHDHGVPEPPEQPTSITPIDHATALARIEERTRVWKEIALEVGRTFRVLGMIAWRLHEQEDVSPAEPWYKGYKWLLRKQREQRDFDRNIVLGCLRDEITAAKTDEERARLQAEHDALKKRHIVELCVDLTVC